MSRQTHSSGGFDPVPAGGDVQLYGHELIQEQTGEIGVMPGSIGTGALQANSVTTEKLLLLDQYGQTILTASGFGDTWRRFIVSGCFNSAFLATPPDAGSDVSDTNPLPFWVYDFVGSGCTVRSVADSTVGSGRVARFTMAAGSVADDTFLSQLVPASSSDARTSGYVIVASVASPDTGLLEVYVAARYYQADGVTPTGSFVTQFKTLTDISGIETIYLAQPIPPADAYFLRVYIGFRRGAAATSATGVVDFQEVRVLPYTRVVPVSDSDPSNDPGLLTQNGGAMFLQPKGSTSTYFRFDSNGDFDMVGGGVGGGVFSTGGTAFPTGGVFADNLFYRKDLDMWFFYDGTRWLSTHLYHAEGAIGDDNFPLSASGNSMRLAHPGEHLGLDIWMEDFYATFFISGGTALSASHKWTGLFAKRDSANAGTTLATITIDSGALSTWRKSPITAIDAVLARATFFELDLAWTKTGTPGTLYAPCQLSYRIVAT